MHRNEKRVVAKMAKGVAFLCIKGSCLEHMHKGKVPESKTGDFGDVRIIDAIGIEHRWDEIARMTQDEHDMLIRNIVDVVSEFLLNVEKDGYMERLEHACEQFLGLKGPDLPKKH